MLIKLTKFSWDEAQTPVLIGTESIIRVEGILLKHSNGRSHWVTEIESRGAMVTTTWVLESVEEIHELTTNP